MNVHWIAMKACYLAVAACVGVQHPPRPPRIDIIPDAPHYDAKGVLKHGFECGTYCLDPPPWGTGGCTDEVNGCPVPPGYCTKSAPAYCAGLTDGGIVTVSDHTTAAIPHEFIHWIVGKKRLWPGGDPGHSGPYWHCEHKDEIPECGGLWP